MRFTLCFSKLRMGCCNTIVDTELSEKSHRIFVKFPYSVCSKRFSTRTMEMARYNVHNRGVGLMMLVMNKEFLVADQAKRQRLDEVEEVEEEDEEEDEEEAEEEAEEEDEEEDEEEAEKERVYVAYHSARLAKSVI